MRVSFVRRAHVLKLFPLQRLHQLLRHLRRHVHATRERIQRRPLVPQLPRVRPTLHRLPPSLPSLRLLLSLRRQSIPIEHDHRLDPVKPQEIGAMHAILDVRRLLPRARPPPIPSRRQIHRARERPFVQPRVRIHRRARPSVLLHVRRAQIRFEHRGQTLDSHRHRDASRRSSPSRRVARARERRRDDARLARSTARFESIGVVLLASESRSMKKRPIVTQCESPSSHAPGARRRRRLGVGTRARVVVVVVVVVRRGRRSSRRGGRRRASSSRRRVVMAKTRRRKRRTHVDADAGPSASAKDVPRTFVFRRGRKADAVKDLSDDVRKVRARCARCTAESRWNE